MKTLKDIKETKDIETFRFNDRDWILKYYSENSKKIENKQTLKKLIDKEVLRVEDSYWLLMSFALYSRSEGRRLSEEGKEYRKVYDAACVMMKELRKVVAYLDKVEIENGIDTKKEPGFHDFGPRINKAIEEIMQSLTTGGNS